MNLTRETIEAKVRESKSVTVNWGPALSNVDPAVLTRDGDIWRQEDADDAPPFTPKRLVDVLVDCVASPNVCIASIDFD